MHPRAAGAVPCWPLKYAAISYAKVAEVDGGWLTYRYRPTGPLCISCPAELDANDGGPHAWDEAWAFWSGSLEGEDGTGDGVMGYALAENRCEQFATCTGDDDGDDAAGTSAVNHDLLELYNEGQDNLVAGNCDDVEGIKENIVNLMTVPLVQGLLR